MINLLSELHIVFAFTNTGFQTNILDLGDRIGLRPELA